MANNKNPDCSTTIQILNDLSITLTELNPEDPRILKIHELRNSLTSEEQNKTDKLYSRHLYKNIEYNRLPVFNNSIGATFWDNLAGLEQQIFTLLCRAAINTYYIRTSYTKIINLTGASKASVYKAMRALEDKNYIALVYKARGRQTAGSIWMINPACIGTGKVQISSIAMEEFKKYIKIDDSETKNIPDSALSEEFEQMLKEMLYANRRYQSIQSTIEVEGRKIYVSELLSYDEYVKQEKELSATHSTDSSVLS